MKVKCASNETAYNVTQSNHQLILDITHDMSRESIGTGGCPMRGNKDISKTPLKEPAEAREHSVEGQRAHAGYSSHCPDFCKTFLDLFSKQIFNDY